MANGRFSFASLKEFSANILVLFFLGVVSIVVLNYSTDIFSPKTVVRVGDDTVSLPSDFPNFEDAQTNNNLYLYASFIMSQPINRDSIVNISRIIKVKGKIKNSHLNYIASVTAENGDNEDRKHTVYFYINDGNTGGHIGADYLNGAPSGDFFTAKNSPHPKKYDLDSLPLSRFPNGPTALVNVEDILNDGKNHYIGSFVSTGIFGVIQKMWIDYECVEDGCAIELIK